MLKSLLAARILVVTGFLVGLTSFSATVSHIGDPNFLLVGSDPADHGYYHFFRELGGDVAAMIIVLFVLFRSSELTRALWIVALLLLWVTTCPIGWVCRSMSHYVRHTWKQKLHTSCRRRS